MTKVRSKWFTFNGRLGQIRERLARFMVWHLLSKQEIYWAVIRAAAYTSTQKEYEDIPVPELRAMDVIICWGKESIE